MPSEIPKLPTDPPLRGFLGVWKLLFYNSLSGWVSIPNSFVSLFIFYILPYLLSKRIGCLSGCLVSSTSVQKLFCRICSAFKCSFDEFVGEKVVSPSYSSAILNFLSYSYLLDVNPSSVISFASIFCGSAGRPLTLSLVSFVVRELLSLIRPHLFMSAFVSFALGNRSKKLPSIYVKECCAYVFKEFYSF